MLDLISETETSLEELNELQSFGNNSGVLGGIGRAFGGILTSATKAGDDIISTIGRTLGELFSTAADGTGKLILNTANGTATIITSGGSAIKSTEEGLAIIIQKFFGGPGGIISLLINLCCLLYLAYWHFKYRPALLNYKLNHQRNCDQENSTSIEMQNPISNTMHQHEMITLLQPSMNTPAEPENIEYITIPAQISPNPTCSTFLPPNLPSITSSETSVVTPTPKVKPSKHNHDFEDIDIIRSRIYPSNPLYQSINTNI